jgi:single-stranded DNA-binding protein
MTGIEPAFSAWEADVLPLNDIRMPCVLDARDLSSPHKVAASARLRHNASMNNVVLVGRVPERPFRPGGGERVVLKVDVADDRGRQERFELDAFGEIGRWVAEGVRIGDIVAIRGRLEQRVYREQGEEVEELRIVGMRISLVAKGSAVRGDRPDHADRGDRPDRERGPRAGRFDRHDDVGHADDPNRAPSPESTQADTDHDNLLDDVDNTV